LPTKSTTTTEGGKRKKEKIQKNLQSKSKHKTNRCFSWVTAVRVLSVTGSHSPPHLPRMPFNTVLISGPVGAAQTLILSTPMCFCLQSPQLSKLVCFLLWECSMTFHMYSIDRVCLVDRVDLFWILYSWWGGLGFS